MIDFVVPPAFYLGAYALVILIFALFGGLCAKKYKWQYAVTKVAAVALSAFLSIALLKCVTPSVGKVLTDLALDFIEESDITEMLSSERVVEWASQIIGVIISFVLFIPLFVIIKAFVNLFFRIIAKAIFRASAKKREAKEEAKVCECMAAAPAAATEATEAAVPEVSESPCEDLPGQQENAAAKENVPAEQAAPAKKKKVNPLIAEKGRGWSFLCGAVSGFLVFVVLSAPLTCFLSDIGGLASTLLYSLEEEEIAENIENAVSNPGTDIISACGGRLIYDSLGSFYLSGEKVTVGNELIFVSDAAEAVLKATSKTLTYDEKALLVDNAIASFEDTSLIPIVAADLICDASEKWLGGEEFIGMERPELGEELDGVIDELLVSFKDSTPNTIREDILSVLRLTSSALRSGALDSLDEGVLKLLENEDFLVDVITVLLENERLSDSVTTVVNMGVTILAETLSVPKSNEAIYESFISTIANARAEAAGETDAEKVLDLADGVKKAYDIAGIDLAYGAEYTIAATLIAKLPESPENKDVKAIFKNKNAELDLYFELKDRFKADNFDPTDMIISLGISEEGIEALTETLVSKFTSEKMSGTDGAVLSVASSLDIENRGVRVTLSDMLIENKNINDTRAEAKNLASAISKALAMASELSGEEKASDIKALMEKLGDLLDALSESELIGDEMVENTVTGLLQSEFVRGSLNIGSVKAASLSANIADAVKNGDTYKQHFVAIGNTINVIVKNDTSTDVPKDEAQKNEEVKELIQNVTPTTSDTLKELVSEEVLVGNGLSEETSESVSDLFGNMFDGMAEINTEDADSEYVEKEAAAVSKALEIATTDPSEFGGGVFGEEGEKEEKIKEYTDLISGSDIMSDVVVDAVYGESDAVKMDPMGFGETLPEDEEQLVIERLDTMYKEEQANGMSAEELKEYEKLVISMAAFVNVDVKIVGGSVVPG